MYAWGGFWRWLIAALLCTSLIASAQTRDPLPVPDILGYRTLKCDFHLHTVFSDGNVWPTIRVDEAWRDGLDVIALTDHDGYTPHESDLETDLNRPIAIARAAAARTGILLVPGVELTKGKFHFNALFATDLNAFRRLDVTSALKTAHSQHAFVFWDHPKPEWFPIIDEAHKAGMLHGIEIVNEDRFFEKAFTWAQEKKLAVIASSDAHAAISDDFPGHRARPVTLLFAKSADLEGIREALDARRSIAWSNGQLWGSEEYLDAIWKAAVERKVTTVQLRVEKESQIELWNRSAIPFDIVVSSAPAWLGVSIEKLKAESIGALVFTATRDAPTGRSYVPLELELRNLHPGPGRNLRIGFPIEIEVVP